MEQIDYDKLLQFLQSRGYKLETSADAEKFASELNDKERDALFADFDRWSRTVRGTKGPSEPSTLPRTSDATQQDNALTPAQRLANVEKFIEGYRKKHPYDQF